MFVNSVEQTPHSYIYLALRRFFFNHELRAAIGAGNKRTRATIGAMPERPLAKAFAAIPLKSIEGNMNLRNTKAMPERATLTHHGHSTSRLSMDSSFRAIKFLLSSSALLLVNQDFLRLITNPMHSALGAMLQGRANFFMDDTKSFNGFL
jgi:hypothetical protein